MPQRNQKPISVEAWKRKLLKNPALKKEYDALEGEFAAYRAQIEADIRAERLKRPRRPNTPKTFGSRSR